VFLLGEAKWLSSVAVTQGIGHDKDQITLRRGFCRWAGIVHVLDIEPTDPVIELARQAGESSG
jgi:hypothetical protein